MDWGILTDATNLRRLLIGDFPEGPLGGLAISLLIGVAAILGSLVLGTVLGLLRNTSRSWVWLPAAIFIEGFRSIPLVMVFFWIWFVPPALGLEINKILTSILALTLFTSTYTAEIVRGGLRSLPHEQKEAALSVGMTNFQALRYVIVPQALRNMIPALTSRQMVTIKNTSLAFLIGLQGFTGVARLINAREFAPITIYLFILVVYFFINRVILLISKDLERRLKWEGTKPPSKNRRAFFPPKTATIDDHESESS